MNGDEVRGTWFYPGLYIARGVDNLLRRVAAELDTGRPAGPLIENASFWVNIGVPWPRGYDVEAVDWFLDRFLLHPSEPELAGMSADPWRDLAVAQLTQTGGSDRVGRPRDLWRYRYFEHECWEAWHSFGQEPGMHLRAGRVAKRRYELRTAEQQTIAAAGSGGLTVRGSDRSFAFRETYIPADSTKETYVVPGSVPDSWPPVIADFAARLWRDENGHFCRRKMSREGHFNRTRAIRALVDETGTPILYSGGVALRLRTYYCVTFPGQRWLRFLVRGTGSANAIMTAVDQAGNRVARYRMSAESLAGKWDSVEIIVHPDRELTDELALAIMLSSSRLKPYFERPVGGWPP